MYVVPEYVDIPILNCITIFNKNFNVYNLNFDLLV